MLDIGWTELLVIAVVLIVVVGPKDLPPMLRAFGKMTSNLRKMAGDFRTQFDEALREADMDGVRQTIDDAKRFHPANAIREAINPLREMGNEIRNDLQKATELPGANTSDAATDSVATTSVDDLIPPPAFSLPETPPLTPPAAPVTSAPASPAVVTPQPQASVVAAPSPSTPPVWWLTVALCWKSAFRTPASVSSRKICSASACLLCAPTTAIRALRKEVALDYPWSRASWNCIRDR